MLFALALSSIYHVSSSYVIFCTLVNSVSMNNYYVYFDFIYKLVLKHLFLFSQNYSGAVIVFYFMLYSLLCTYFVSVAGQNLLNEASVTNRVISK